MKKILICFLIPLFIYSQQQITETMLFDGIEREYIIYVPEIYQDGDEVPVLFSFHGGGGYASDFIQANDMRPLADTANFIAVVYRQAIKSSNEPINLTVSNLATLGFAGFIFGPVIVGYMAEYFGLTFNMYVLSVIWAINGLLLLYLMSKNTLVR